MSDTTLFDKIIDIELVGTNNKVTRILCPRTGMKPAITISGNLAANTIQNGVLKITNFYPDKPLNTSNQEGGVYKWLRITAGYSQGETSTIEGQSFLAYTESPGPDGVSVITFFTGPMDVWMTVPINKNWEPGVSLNTVLTDFCNMLKKSATLEIRPKSYVSASLKVQAPGLSVSGTASDLVDKIHEAYGFAVYPEGLDMIMCDPSLGRTEEFKLKYVTSIKKTAAGYTVVAPWIPGLRMNHTLVIDSKYYTVENYGAMGVAFDTKFTVVSIAFEFSTTSQGNSMTVLCIGQIPDYDKARKVSPGAS